MRVEVLVGKARLDLGTVERLAEGGRLLPPSPSQFDQLVAILEGEAPGRARKPTRAQEGRAAVAVCLRWGSYLALLMDPQRPPAPSVTQPGVSRVTDREMARINIEASTNLARWLQLAHDEPDRYASIVAAASTLPMPTRPRASPGSLSRLVQPKLLELADMFAAEAPAVVARVKRAPIRTLANTLVHACWRNGGPIEDFHAGDGDRVRLNERRFSAGEARVLMQDAMARFSDAIQTFRLIEPEWGTRNFDRYAVALHVMPFVGATGWTTEETSREIILRPDEIPA